MSDDVAYLTATDRVYAIDIQPDTNNQQRELWTYPPATEGSAVTFHGQPYLSEDGILYAGTDSATSKGNYVVALNTRQVVEVGEPPNTVPTASVKWLAPNPPSLSSIFGGLTGDGRALYFGTDGHQVVSLDVSRESPTVGWVYTTTERIWSMPVVTGSVAYATSQDASLYALDAETGRPLWDEPFTASATLAGNPAYHDGVVYVGSFDQRLSAVDAATGEQRWEFATQGWLWDGPAVFDDTLYFGDLSGYLYALDLNGQPVWPQPVQLTGMIRAAPLVTADRLYVATGARKVYALDRESGRVQWEFTGDHDGEQFLTTPVLAGDQLLAAPLPAGASPVRLYAINAASGNALWQFPAPSN